MNIQTIIERSKDLSFSNANYLIANTSGLKLELIQNLSFCKIWKVLDNKEIYLISNTIKELNEVYMSDVKYWLHEV